MMAQDGGFRVPVGRRAVDRGARQQGSVGRCADRVREKGRGDRRSRRSCYCGAHDARATVRTRRAVIADTSAPRLYCELLPAQAVPDAVLRSMRHFVWDTPVLKVNYAIGAAIPWRSKSPNDAGTVHLGADHDGLIRWMTDLNTAMLPERPLMLFGQMTTADPRRSPSNTESA
jgi:hypothetical protein